ncbi:MAG: RNA-binding transcriptional accessory protein [Deltaproteobacteria bacterium]|nr:RNA-binding transcriptional accessory protein [Deltaproteobacteria bacterium]
MQYFEQIAKELGIAARQVQAVAALLDEGATIPFIARYRKEAHGSLDEVAITAVRDRLGQLRELEARRQAILKSLAERNLLTEELQAQVNRTANLVALEDVYLPYRPKRRTRATIAREKGLEPLALALLEQKATLCPQDAAAAFVNPEKEVASVEDALAGARDIIAETVSEDARARTALRDLFARKALATSAVSKGKEAEGAKFSYYFAWQETAAKAAGHRLLAMLRGEAEGVLNLHFLPETEPALEQLHALFVKNASPAGLQVREAVDDGYKRLLAPSLETELRGQLREKAEHEAIVVFARNLRQLLLASPLGQKRVLAIDPGFRTGCKVVCLDAQGALLHHDLIYVMSPEQQKTAGLKLQKLCDTYKIEAVGIGNGTAGRETESLVRAMRLSVPVLMVSESGASVYSASEAARKEFPDLDLTVRGAVSIGRRLMDPLAELVKIDPKAIGVGQYQHDVDQGQLKQSLTDVVESCVNAVGVELNTASAELLTHVSGLGPALAKAVITYREANGPFKQRRELLKVPRLGPKAFEQAAGFLRIHGGKNPLDASAVHPESYNVVEAMAKDLGCAMADMLAKPELRRRVQLKKYLGSSVGLPTLNDIMSELEKPGRDPREAFEAFAFAEGVSSMNDLEPGMRLPGIVTNVTNFGAFVDIGVHQDGLVHVSQLADHFVSDPHAVLKVQQKVRVTVLEVDADRKRIALSLREHPESAPVRRPQRDDTAAEKTQGKPKPAGQRKKDEAGHRPFQGLLPKPGK